MNIDVNEFVWFDAPVEIVGFTTSILKKIHGLI